MGIRDNEGNVHSVKSELVKPTRHVCGSIMSGADRCRNDHEIAEPIPATNSPAKAPPPSIHDMFFEGKGKNQSKAKEGKGKGKEKIQLWHEARCVASAKAPPSHPA